MNYINEKTIKKIGFYYILERLSVSSVYGRDLLGSDILNTVPGSDELIFEYEGIEECISLVNNHEQFEKLTDILAKFRDVRNTFKRCGDGEILDEVELYEIKYFCLLSSELKVIYENSGINIHDLVLYDFSKILRLLNPLKISVSSFHIYDEYSEKLFKIRSEKMEYDRMVFNEKNKILQKKMFEKREKIVEKEKMEEFEVRSRLCSLISQYVQQFLEEAMYIGRLDLLLAKAKLALDYDMCRPKISKRRKFVMDNGRNPMIEEKINERGGRFLPVSIEVSEGTTVITGANMGGKTVLLSTVALNYMMASLGFYAFADYFEFTPLDFMYFLSEDFESLDNGLSTFGGEIMELKDILEKIKCGSGLVIMDEFARGTNPEEGNCITKALVNYLNKFDSFFIISTHYDRVGSFAKIHYQIKGLKYVNFDIIKKYIRNRNDCLKTIADNMDYTLELVDEDTSVPKDAVNLCRLIGIDEEIISSAQLLYNKERKNEKQT